MKSCLIVDDSKVIRMVAKKILHELEFRTAEAEDGVQALNSCRNEMPDAVLLDWNMPNMNGIECLEAMRSSGSTVPFGFVTSEGSPEMREKAADAGALFLIAKPFNEDIFKEHLDGVIS